MEEVVKDKVSSFEDHIVLKKYEDVFGEIPRFPLKRDIDFSIDFMLGAALVFKNPYRMSTPKLKEL